MSDAGALATGRAPLQRLAAALWRLLVIAVVLLAVYVAAGRVLTANVSTLQDELLHVLNERLPFELSAANVTGRMEAFSPELVFTDLRLTFPGEAVEPLQLASGSVRLAPLRSLLTRSPQASVVTLSGLSLELERDAAGALQLRGFGFREADGGLRDWLAGLLPRIRSLTLEDNRVLLLRSDGPDRRARVDLTLRRSGSERTLDARLASAAGNRATLHAEGIGDPLALESWQGAIFLGLEAEALGRVFDWLPPAVPVRASGTASAQLWLQRAGGRSDLRLSLGGSGLTLSARGGSWSVPLEALAMDAALSEQEGGWDLHASKLALAQGGRDWYLPRARFETRGDSLRVRTGAFRLDGVDGLLASLPTVPGPLADALQVLAPRGEVRALDVSLDDLRTPAAGWDLAARVDGLAVDSWRGAPGTRGASAFVHLYPGGGDIRIDSEDISLLFPKVYRQALAYASVHGDLDLAWNGDGLSINSGLLTATGAEGSARALLALSIPFSRTATGPVMELLVGLRDSSASYRGKYLPYRLPAPLRDWLARSVQTGDLDTGAFAWRGSLRRGNPEHLSVQFFADVANARLAYDENWPPLEDFAGRVLVDDSRVSVWGDEGRLRAARVESLSAESWRGADGARILAIDGSIAGDAADGLAVVNASPLAAQADDAFRDWTASGALRVGLELELPLQGGAPQVTATAQLRDGSLRIVPGNLDLADVQGEVRFRSGKGFSSSELSGRLFGDTAVSARLEQDGAREPLRVLFQGEAVALASVEAWLGAEGSWPADGAAALSGELTVAAGKATRLSFASDLVGIELALPPPWGKGAQEPRPLRGELALGGGELALDLSLGPRLGGRLLFADEQLQGGSLRLESDWLQGALDFQGSMPQLIVDWLDLDGLPEREGSLDFATIHRTLRPLAVSLLELRKDGERVGALAFELDRDERALYARGIRGELFGLHSSSEEGGLLRWSDDKGPRTELAMDVRFGDLGDVFTALGYAPTMVSSSGRAEAALAWPGAPPAFTLETLNGTLAVSAREGRLLDARGSGGALKVVTLLNLAEILRGLSLAQMFESGIPFERAASEFHFRAGELEIPSLTLRGAASAFEFSGVTDLERIDGELVVTLPVASNLPWMAALAGGLPVAAGVYVVSKVFEKQVKRMSSGVYEVAGPLGNPEVELRRIFDDRANALPENGEAATRPGAETESAATGGATDSDDP